MEDVTRVRFLRYALVVVGLLFIAPGYYVAITLWPSVSSSQPNPFEAVQMLLSLYVTLGIFLLIAARNPLRHRSLIWFTVWSSVAHGGVMALQAIHAPGSRFHLLSGTAGLLVIAILLAALTPPAVVPEPNGD